MSRENERKAFAERLKSALRKSRKKIKGPADLATQFSLRHGDDAPITPQAAHKWLTGKALPSAAKIKTLAEWLGVSTHWLRFGAPEITAPSLAAKDTRANDAPYSPQEAERLLAGFRDLTERQRELILEMIEELNAGKV